MLKNKRKFLKWSANNARMNKIILRKLLIMDVIFDGIGTEINDGSWKNGYVSKKKNESQK